jgi:hypothetical protein
VEDRFTPLLYLELGDASPEDGATRAQELAGREGVERVTWWENCVFERSDLPMRIQDGRTLVVAEAGAGFAAPSPGPGVLHAHCFRRHSRPSQGVLTEGPTLGLSIVWISPKTPDLARSLRDWGDFVHIRHIAAAGIPGFTQISVYENAAESEPRYMHFYEFDNAEAEATFATMIGHVAPRLGGTESAAYAEWADWRPPGGRLFYCNTFSRLGEVTAVEVNAATAPSTSSTSSTSPT